MQADEYIIGCSHGSLGHIKPNTSSIGAAHITTC